ncbi:hypothetical protein [Magnetofaba australis]|uniref:SbsA Ig-like domain-containing protein n=1 Tax=Magnetofaba australis IT-1 TaxID=1434232 RepID=A0A1Y2K168_9PROT|nr:hypothetical protein [Magnetofaba australis]OSM00041.1 hypothetical protein MAIT1_00449 [Magnetofaba australis IT-1]
MHNAKSILTILGILMLFGAHAVHAETLLRISQSLPAHQSTVEPQGVITLTFDQPIPPGVSLTTNINDRECLNIENIQVSTTNFAYCVQMKAQPKLSPDRRSLTLEPLAWESQSRYLMRLVGTKKLLQAGVRLDNKWLGRFRTVGQDLTRCAPGAGGYRTQHFATPPSDAKPIKTHIVVLSDDYALKHTFPLRRTWANGSRDRAFFKLCPAPVGKNGKPDWASYEFNACMAPLLIEDLNREFAPLAAGEFQRFQLSAYTVACAPKAMRALDHAQRNQQFEAIQNAPYILNDHLNVVIGYSGRQVGGFSLPDQPISEKSAGVVVVDGGGRYDMPIVHEVGHLVGFPHLVGARNFDVMRTLCGKPVRFHSLREDQRSCEANIMGTWRLKGCPKLSFGDIRFDTSTHKQMLSDIFGCWLTQFDQGEFSSAQESGSRGKHVTN